MAAGAPPTGAASILVLAPLAVIVFSVFWLAAGASASPAATLQRYVAAWRHDRPAEAAPLFEPARDAPTVDAAWRADDAYLRTRLLELSGTLGAGSGLDPDEPFASLDVELPAAGNERSPLDGRATAELAIVRRERVRSTLFGLFPTASQRDVVVERLGQVTLRAVPSGLPFGPVVAHAWRIESVQLGPG
ncbi:MAG TPA: hypothetical protein VGQ47_03200 [Candidatus Limnocylindrales bacterium]|nr:hypothetical protein [Candidatus Limnocylindrales bacterium]